MTTVRNRRALVTGAGHGLGQAIAGRLARAGAEVIVTDRDAERVAAAAGALGRAGLRAFGYPLDVTAEDQVRSVRDRLNAERGPIDLLVNNAGVVFGGDFLGVPLARHRATVEVNLTGVLTVTHAFLPDLLARPAGHIVNVASAAVLVALPGAASYAASKWAVLGFSESLREELRLRGHRHVRVTTVCPSYTATGLFAGARPPGLTWLLRPEDVAASVLRAVERDRELLFLPWTTQLFAAACGVLPRRLYRRLCALLGVSTSMAGWRGHPEEGEGKGRPPGAAPD
jgi:short-subunit dehydrogenase